MTDKDRSTQDAEQEQRDRINVLDRDIFVSHRNRELDNRYAHSICKGLAAAKVTAWLDQDRLHAGSSYKREITEAIRRARVVVCIFDGEPSDWLIFEAGCAFFDHKLLPVSINQTEIPAPFSGIQAITLPAPDDPAFEAELENLVELCKNRVHGDARRDPMLPAARMINRAFRSGVALLYLAFAAFLTFTLGSIFDADTNTSQSWYDTLHHSHAIIGSITLGGGLFIPIILARAQASPSFRERRFGSKLAMEMYWLWLFIAILGPVFGFLMTRRAESPYTIFEPWVSLAVMLYLFSLVLWLLGYALSQGAHSADMEQNARKYTVRSARANLVFLAAFAVNVLVVNLMLFKYDLGGGAL